MAPEPCRTMCGAAARAVSNAVTRWASRRSWNCALVMDRIEEPGGSAVPAQLIRMSMRPNSATHASTSPSATAGSAGEPLYPTPETCCAACATASGSRPLTSTRAPSAASSSATASPIPRVPPTTTAARSASTPLICHLHLGERHRIHVPVAAQVGDEALVVHPVGEHAADGGHEAVRKLGAQHQDVGDLGRRGGRERLLAGDRELVGADVGVEEGPHGLLAAHPAAVRVGDGRADRVLDDDVVGHQREPAFAVTGLHTAPGCLGGEDDG